MQDINQNINHKLEVNLELQEKKQLIKLLKNGYQQNLGNSKKLIKEKKLLKKIQKPGY